MILSNEILNAFHHKPHGTVLVGIKNSIIYQNKHKRGWDKSPSLSIVFGLSSKTQWLSGLYYADFISFYSPTQLCGGGTTKSNSNELPISVPLSFLFFLTPFACNRDDCCYQKENNISGNWKPDIAMIQSKQW
ncbi:hypothetical protein D8872_07500 [Streptococcus cristatus]|uniref:Uncharacterized protein n=1 Tax=Streptococcus cristatus TaxID=45634 RepID=A0A3R9HDB9_STRCR|nr:hypothetical protein D8872_07500 [Streptococcus cristatus]